MDSLLHLFLREQGYVLFEPRADGTFRPLSSAPEWFVNIWGGPKAASDQPLRLGDRSPFLENFLIEAREFWDAGTEEVCASETWMESAGDFGEIPLEAVAIRLDGKPLLSIHRPQAAFDQRSQILQTARDSKRIHERLLKEIQKKEILLHCIIHDLSQPLAAMRGCFECLAAEETTAKAKEFVDIGKQQSERQETMIREILRAFAEDLKAEIDPGGAGRDVPDLLRCARECVAAFTPVFESKGAAIELSAAINPSGGWKVAGDASRLQRIFSNLVENALRYAPRNSQVTIGIEEDGNFLVTSIEDQGPGLPKGSTPANIFALFGQGKESGGKEGGGKAGLGLYFCRVTVERWGGAIGCESRTAGGARFWFRLPKAAASTKAPGANAKTSAATQEPRALVPRGTAPAPSPEIAAPKLAPPLHILLAEDQEDVRDLTKYLLAQQGHQVVAVENGREALNVLAKKHFDVVLLDEEMPVMGGLAAVEWIRAHEKTRGGHQFVLAVTGNTTEADHQRLLRAGMDACLDKPLHLAALNRLLADVHLQRAPSSEDTRGPQKRDSAPVDLLARVGGDPKLLQKMIKTFRRDSLRKLAEMKQALARKNAMALATAAHALKGSASIFGSEKATRCAQKLQEMGRSGKIAQAAGALRELQEEIAHLHAQLNAYSGAPPSAPSRSAKSKRQLAKAKPKSNQRKR